MARTRHLSPPLAVLAVVFTVLGFILVYTFSQIYGNLLADQVTNFVAAQLGMSAARMTAQFAPYVLPGGLAAMCLWAAFLVAAWYVRHTEFSPPPDRAVVERQIAAQEAQAEAIRRQTAQRERESDPLHRALLDKQTEDARKAFGVGIRRADVRLGFKWYNEASPETADFRFDVSARLSAGSKPADLQDACYEWRDTSETSDSFGDAAVRRHLGTFIEPSLQLNVLSGNAPKGDESKLLCGYVTWSDEAGEWEQLFCMQIRTHPNRNEHHFTQVGGAPWNNVRQHVRRQISQS
jgi:hypothetical protein